MDGLLQRNGVETPSHRIAAFDDLADDLVEHGIRPAMRRNDRESSAPGCNGLGHAIEEALVGVQGELVKFDMAALSGERIRV